MELKEKVILITGSSDGIGAEAAKLFAKQGAHVIITYNKQRKKAEKVYDECDKYWEAMLVPLDVSDEKSIEKAVEDVIDKYGAIDILVNNAGIAFWKEFVEQTNEMIDMQIDVNLKGLLKMTKSVLPYMQAQGEGLIINIGSGAGKTGIHDLTTYCATKFGVRGFSKALSKELSEDLRVYVFNPGMTSTRMTNYQGDNPKDVAKLLVETAKESLGKTSGEDVDVWEYL